MNLQAQLKNKTITKSGKLKFLGKNLSYVSLVHIVRAIPTALTGFPNLTRFLNEFESLIVN